MIQTAIVLSVLAVVFGLAAGPRSGFQRHAWLGGWGCVAGVGALLLADLVA